MNIKKVAPYVTETVQGSKGPVTKANGEDKAALSGASSDKLKLSRHYQVITQAKKVISVGGEVRVQKVEHVRSQIANRTYVVNPEDVASKMLDEVI